MNKYGMIAIIFKDYNIIMTDLNEKLLIKDPKGDRVANKKRRKSYLQTRLSVLYQKFVEESNSINSQYHEEENQIIRSKISSSIVQSQWSQEQLSHRNLILQEPIQPVPQNFQNQQKKGRSQKISNLISNSIYREKQGQSGHKAVTMDLNTRMFSMDSQTQKFLYYFNFLLNTIFRASIIVMIVFMFIDEIDYRLPLTFIQLIVISWILYGIALTKMVFTKSGLISVYLQKVFYNKPYADIEMDRILRKHFTFKRIMTNLYKFLNPFTEFNKDIKICLLKQQILKRIELMLVFIPLAIMFGLQIQWFKYPDFPFKGSDKFIAGFIALQFSRLCIHYLIIYVTS